MRRCVHSPYISAWHPASTHILLVCTPVTLNEFSFTQESEENSDLLLPLRHAVFTKFNVELIEREIILDEFGLIRQGTFKEGLGPF